MHAEEQARSPQRELFNPFSGKSNLQWMMDRMHEGYFGSTASYDRSPAFQERFEATSLTRITAHRKMYKDLLAGKTELPLKPLGQSRDTEDGNVSWNKDLEIARLAEEWKTVQKGGAEELDWVERAIAISVAGFEEYQRKRGVSEFSMRDNQIYYMTSLLLNKGKYEFGALETDMRGIELPTGEGKTFCFGLVAPIFALQESPVIVMEPNYVSAQSHARQMAEFYETFYRQTTGVVVSVPEREGFAVKQLPDEHGVFGKKIVPTGGFKSYRSINGVLVEDQGLDGRRKAWSQKIVYLDSDSLAFDWLADHQIGTHQKSGQPALEDVTMLVAEADDLMIDKARNPYITSEAVKGPKAWDNIGEIAGLEALYPDDWSEKERRQTTQRAIFTLWGNLYEAKRMGYFREGFGDTNDYLLVNRQLKESDRLMFKANNVIAKNLSGLFGYDASAEEKHLRESLDSWGARTDTREEKGWDNAIELIRKAYSFRQPESEKILRSILAKNDPTGLLSGKIIQALKLDHEETVWHAVSDVINSPSELSQEARDDKLGFLTPENREALHQMINWLDGNSEIVDAAVHALFGMQVHVDFIGKDKPVLLDDYGFPLERRQLHDAQQIFLQLHHAWQKEGMDSRTLTPELLLQLEKKYYPSVEISYTMNRITLPALFEKCKRVRFSSGSLLPAAQSFSDLYNAEVLAVGRHLEIPPHTPPEKKTAMFTTCLDGGIAQVDYLASPEAKLEEMERRAADVRKTGRMGLFIVPDIRMATELKKRIPSAEIATGADELRERGLLDKVTSVGEPGKVVITTWIAHRDIDVKMPQEVLENGGLDCVVSGIPPTERGLWQAVQRALRGDQPGSRSLLLAPDDFIPLQNRDLFAGPTMGLFHRPVAKTHAEAVNKIENQWMSALKGDRHAMQKLFGDYLAYLRGKEGVMRQQLMRTMIRDCDLENWQRMFVEGKGDLSQQTAEYMRLVEDEARKRIPASIPSMYSMPSRHGETARRTEAVLSRLESQFGYVASEAALLPRVMDRVRQEDLREGWADFLRFLDLDSFTFHANIDNQKLQPDMQRALFRTHIESLLKQEQQEKQ